MRYIKLYESYIDSEGKLKDFDHYSQSSIDKSGDLSELPDLSLDDIMPIDKFEEWVIQGVEDLRFEEICDIYDMFPDDRKKIIIKELLGLFLLEVEITNTNIVKDALKWFPEELDEYMNMHIHYWWDFGNGVLEWNPESIKILPLEYQEKALEYMNMFNEYELEMSDAMINSFHPSIQLSLRKIFN